MNVEGFLQIAEMPLGFDVETIVACAKILAKSATTKNSQLAGELKQIKAAHSTVTVDAAMAILKHFEIPFDQTQFVKDFFHCDYSQYYWLHEPLILKNEKLPLDDWQIPHIGGSRYLTESDVVDLDKIALRLKDADADDNASRFIRARLAADTVKLLQRYNGKSGLELKKHLLDDLNKIITQNELEHWVIDSKIQLSAETRETLGEKLPVHRRRLNRLILAEIYPGAFAPCPLFPVNGFESWQLSNVAAQNICELLGNAAVGSRDAAEQCAKVLCFAVNVMNDLRLKHPKLFQSLVRQSDRWPVLKSTHPRFDDNESELMQDLGKGLTPFFDSSTKWNPQDPVTEVAIEIYEHVERMREKAKHFIWLGQKKPTKEWKQTLSENPWIIELASLGKFDHDSAVIWWEHGRRFFDRTYPDPLKIFGLTQPRVKQSNARPVYAGTLSRPISHIKRDLKKEIKDKFISLAGR
jgi:hypothetical protein